MSIETVAVTGGNGQIGRALLSHLDEHGYRTVNVNRGSRRENVSDAYLRTDLTDAGEVYGSLAKSDADAVVHLGMVPTPERTPEFVTYESNAASSYLVLEAATNLGIDTVVLVSSLSAMGGGFEPGPVDVRYLPVEESHPLTPTTPYGLGKQVLETNADAFARREDGPRTVASLRYPWVTTDDDLRETFVEPDRSLAALRDSEQFHTARNTLFAYVHLDDAVRLTRAAVEATFEGHERFWAVGPDTTVEAESSAVAAAVYPDAEIREPLSETESFVSTAKARRLLDWKPERSWRELTR